jgi:hypothetical protein
MNRPMLGDNGQGGTGNAARLAIRKAMKSGGVFGLVFGLLFGFETFFSALYGIPHTWPSMLALGVAVLAAGFVILVVAIGGAMSFAAAEWLLLFCSRAFEATHKGE